MKPAPPVEQGSTVVELGPGHGFALRQILEKRPARVYGVEISESFRSILESDPAFRFGLDRPKIIFLTNFLKFKLKKVAIRIIPPQRTHCQRHSAH